MKVKGVEQQHISSSGKVVYYGSSPRMMKCGGCERLVGHNGKPPKKCPHCGKRWKKPTYSRSG